MSEIIVVGSINMDLVVRIERAPDGGETLSGFDFQTIPGGKGANQAVAAARLGGNVFMIGMVGEDRFGSELSEKLTQNQVNVSGVSLVNGISTGVAMIIVEEKGENRIIIVPGANGCLTVDAIDLYEKEFQVYDTLVVQLETPLETVIHAVSKAKQNQKIVIFNPAPAPREKIPSDILGMIDFLVLNESEAKSMTGITVNTVEDGILASKKLHKSTGNTVILTMGETGSIALDSKGAWYVSAYKINAVDTTAAGDAFIGAIAVFHETKEIPELIRWANAAGAIAATRLGAQTSLPSLDDLRLFIRNNGQNVEIQKII